MDKLKGKVFHKEFRFWIFRVSLFQMKGFKRVCVRTEMSWGWDD